jgi:primosomal protein N' (replication factor Y)
LESAFATSELVEIVDLEPVVTEEIFKLARQVANRQSVALGEILQHAVVEHMPRITKPIPESNQEAVVEVPEVPGITSLAKRSAVLTSARSLTHLGMRYPDWCWLFLRAAVESIQVGKSAILIVPERDQISQLAALFSSMGLKDFISTWLPGAKKSDRFTNFHRALSQERSIVIGSRSAIYAPVRNLGVIALFDDGDDSLREQGSPYTHAREISLMRATDDVKLLFAANYRSLEIQRLVEIGYLTDLDIKLPPARISC